MKRGVFAVICPNLSRAERTGHRDGEVGGRLGDVGLALSVEGGSKTLAPGVLDLHVPERMRLRGHQGRDVAVVAGKVIAGHVVVGLGARRRAGGAEAGGVLGLKAADVEVEDTILLATGRGEVRHLPGQSWALSPAQRAGRGEAGGGESNGEDGSELHDGELGRGVYVCSGA